MEVDLSSVQMVADPPVLGYTTYDPLFPPLLLPFTLDLPYGLHYSNMWLIAKHATAPTRV
ncbi:hypothetical protein DPMN_041994 [Dreissena polymorpha]|uniref:Uncharacterized protein n=1 Tax=Dreissena polymorpha TaxID=45954 RepID=A0A9D4CZQ4_DREPO|nr:hypothetical protein DPMN_041994 [Dreissena polymorpha]